MDKVTGVACVACV